MEVLDFKFVESTSTVKIVRYCAGNFTIQPVNTECRKQGSYALVNIWPGAYFCFRKLIDADDPLIPTHPIVQTVQKVISKSFEKPNDSPRDNQLSLF